MKKIYLWIIPIVIIWEIVANAVTFYFDPTKASFQTLLPLTIGVFFVGLLPSIFLLYMLSRQTTPMRKKMLLIGYGVAVPFALLFGSIGPSASELLVENIGKTEFIKNYLLIPLVFVIWGTPPLFAGIFLGKLFAPLLESDETL